jgi:hypothetical protein
VCSVGFVDSREHLFNTAAHLETASTTRICFNEKATEKSKQGRKKDDVREIERRTFGLQLAVTPEAARVAPEAASTACLDSIAFLSLNLRSSGIWEVSQ